MTNHYMVRLCAGLVVQALERTGSVLSNALTRLSIVQWHVACSVHRSNARATLTEKRASVLPRYKTMKQEASTFTLPTHAVELT